MTTPDWHGSKAQAERVAMMRALHLMRRTLPPMTLSFDRYQCNVRELVNDFDECGRSVWREPYSDERYRP